MKTTNIHETELFPILFKLLGSEPHARIAGHTIFWLQYARFSLRGRVGIFKEDKELEVATGKQSAGRLLLHLSRLPNTSTPPKPKPRRLRPVEPLFEVAYGPKPGQHSGRVRWIFATEHSWKIVQGALEARQQKAGTGEGKTPPSMNVKSPHQSPQIGPPLISHTDSSKTHSTALSPANATEKELDSVSEKKIQAEMSRIYRTWNTACEKSNKHHLKWTRSDQSRLSPQLTELIDVLQIENLSDEALRDRLNLLCNRLDEVGSHLSDAFQSYNKNGLTAESFARYGRELMAQAEKMLSDGKVWAKMKKGSDFFK